MSQVKNLRAMFEQKGETSPPDRGRSPGIPAAGTESPRPLSTIRTNFIAVEKDGRIGLQRDPSRDSSVSTARKVSGEADTAAPPTLADKANIPDKMDTAPKTSLREQPIPESPRVDTAEKAAATPKVQGRSSTPSRPLAAKPDTEIDAGAKAKPVVNGHGSTASNGITSRSTNNPAIAKDTGKAKEGIKTSVRAATTAAATANASSSNKSTGKAKAPPLLTAKTATTTKPMKSPTVAKAPKSPVVAVPNLPAKTPEKKSLHPEKVATPKTTASASKPGGTASATKKPPPLQHPSGIGFVKPKVKSPTRPIKLPASLMTHTAASGSKVNVPRQSLSRASGTLQPVDSLGRSPSRLSVSTVATSTTNAGGGSTKSLRRQNSTINRPRPSLGPPPKPNAKDHPPTKKEKEVDEGFLARMMRPTQASSSKANEKMPTTPPRKTAPKATPKSETKRPAPVAPRVAEPNTSSPPRQGRSSEPLEETNLESTTPQDEDTIGTVTQESAASEEVAETGHASEHHLDEHLARDETAQEVAIATEQAEPAEGAIQIAKDIEGEVKLTEDSDSNELAEEAGPKSQEMQTEPADVTDTNEDGNDSLVAEAPTTKDSSLTPEPANQPGGGDEDPNDELESY
ncbi:hypothetical protein GQ53DRAFT_816367 [Thozetella sp. PMI_491]|nr:hypothetical protein GQ53DRAFT_816367 [Thozetella sp. PMI_491]